MTRKTRELFDARLENATLKLQVEALERELQRDAAEVNRLREQFAEESRQTRENLEVALDRATKAERDAAIYRERLDIVANHLPPSQGPTVKHMSEEVEDLEYLFNSGQIDKGQLEAELQAAGFQSAEIELDLTPPRL